jgi:hypothetical protein
MILLALLVFTIFSIVCGAVTGMTELFVYPFSLNAYTDKAASFYEPSKV